MAAASPDTAFEFAPGPPPIPVERGRERRRTATIVDLEYPGLWNQPVEAYLVLPRGGSGPWPAVLYQHWYAEEPNANRTQFVDEGVDLAADGIASLHVQGSFPWGKDPSGIEADRAGVIGHLVDLRRGLDVLAARPDVDGSRLVFVGHDFGGMYGALLTAVDGRLRGLAILAAVPSWSDWFVPFWRVLGDGTEADYRAAMADLDPASYLGRIAPRPVLFQFASDDRYVDEAARRALVKAAGEPKESKTYEADHGLDNEDAAADRVAWIRRILSA